MDILIQTGLSIPRDESGVSLVRRKKSKTENGTVFKLNYGKFWAKKWLSDETNYNNVQYKCT